MPVDHPFVAPSDPAPANPWAHIQPAPAMLPPGIHLLDSLASGGQILIVAIDPTGKLLTIGCISQIAMEELWFPDAECVEFAFHGQLFDGTSRRSLGIRALSPGVHQAPWRPRFAVGGQALLTVNHVGRIAAAFEVPTDRQPNDPELLTQLERVARESVTANQPPRNL
jgi:hypothetical protein